jgi:peptidyl-prolyl cis-trans isomerase C
VAGEDEAKAALASLEGGADFAELAGELSLDESTKGKGGRIEDDVVKGSYVPGIGDANEINAAIFAADAPAVLETPFQTDQGWEVVKIEEKHPERQKSFEEVGQQVMMELLQRKRQDVQRAYIDQMMDKYSVVVHTSAFQPADPNAPEGSASSQ